MFWPNMLFIFENGQFGQIKKDHFFHEQNFEITFLDLYIRGKL